jgi:hypothetical protein
MEHSLHTTQTSSTNTSGSGSQTIILAGATGNLGHRIASYLTKYGTTVKALVRKRTKSQLLASLQQQKLHITEVNFNDTAQLTQACRGGTCVISALNGLEDVLINVQEQLLTAAINAGVPRFIPSDYCIDYTKLSYGSNRNLDLRRKFTERLNQAPISATSILNGMFTNLLTGEAPVILFGLKRVVYWGDANQLLDFTTMENTAEYTARAALDNTTPRYLRIAGEVTNAKGLQQAASEATGKEFRLFKAGSLNSLQNMTSITRTLFPKKKEVFPSWQGMQYLHNMFTGAPKLSPLDNDRYTGIHWTSVKEILVKRVS